MIEWTVITGAYALGFVANARLMIWHDAKRWPSLQWKGKDTTQTVVLSVFWPIIIWMVSYSCLRLAHPPKPRKPSLFAKIHAADVARNRRTER